MGDGFEILFWLAVFAVLALRGASRNRSAGRASSDASDGDASSEPRRGVLADIMRQIEAQVEAQRREAEAQAAARRRGPDVPTETGPGSGGSGAPAPWERRPVPSRSGATVLDDRSGREPASAERGLVSGRASELTVPRSEPGDTFLVPGRRVHAPGTVTVGRSPEAASALARGSRTRPIGPGETDDGPTVDSATRRPGARGLAALDRYRPAARAVILAEVLGPPPGLSGRPSVDRRLDEMA